jgi:hypothetical protein
LLLALAVSFALALRHLWHAGFWHQADGSALPRGSR